MSLLARETVYSTAHPEAGETLLRPGDRVGHIFFLQSGSLEYSWAGDNDAGRIVFSIPARTLVGAGSLADGSPVPFTVRAGRDCRLTNFRLVDNDFQATVSHNATFGVSVARSLLMEIEALTTLLDEREDFRNRLRLLAAAAGDAPYPQDFFTLPVEDLRHQDGAPFEVPDNSRRKAAVYTGWLSRPAEIWRDMYREDPGPLLDLVDDILEDRNRLLVSLASVLKETHRQSAAILHGTRPLPEPLKQALLARFRRLWDAEPDGKEHETPENVPVPESAEQEKPGGLLHDLKHAAVFLTRHTVLGLLTLLCFATGFISLLYETLWLRQFGILLGNTTYTTSAVIAAFLAGLASGSMVFGRLFRRTRHGILWFALLEVGVVGSVFVLSRVLGSGLLSSGAVAGLGSGDPLHILGRFGIGFALVLIPTFLMGGALPALSRHFEYNRIAPGLSVGLLYGINTIGACGGTFVAGFFMIGKLGMTGSMEAALKANLLVALAALVLVYPALWAARRTPAPLPDSDPFSRKEEKGAPPVKSDISRWTIYLLAAGAGFVALTYEIILFRILGYLLGNRAFATSTLLAVYLFGLGAGSMLIARLLDALNLGIRTFSVLFILAGLYMLGTIVYFPDFLAFAADMEKKFGLSKPGHFIIARSIEAAVVILPPTLLFGAAFPLLIRKLKELRTTLTEGLGRINLSNTVGSVLGSFAAGMVLVPLAGTYRSMVFLSILSVLLGFRVFMTGRGRIRFASGVFSLLFVLFIGWRMYASAMPATNFPWLEKGQTLVDMKEDALALLTVRRDVGGISIWADSTKIVWPVGGQSIVENVQRLQGHLPALIHPSPTNALIIGMGAGITSGAMSLHPELKRVDSIEIYPGVVPLLKYFKQFNDDILNRTNSRIHIADGRYFLAASGTRYDIISVNITNPYLPGCAAFYTVEFVKLVRSRLKRGGLLLNHLYGKDWKFLLKTVASVFPHIRLFWGYGYGTRFMIASMEPIRLPTPAEWYRKTVSPALRISLAKAWLYNPWSLAARQAGGQALVDPIRRDNSIPLHYDDLPVIEYRWFEQQNEKSDLFKSH